jgi:hypothetical protein
MIDHGSQKLTTTLPSPLRPVHRGDLGEPDDRELRPRDADRVAAEALDRHARA